MTTMSTAIKQPATTRSQTDVPPLQRWLTERVALYLEKTPDQIDPTVALAEIGLDSVYALSMCGDIEDHLGLEVDATLIWDYPTIAAIANHLHNELVLKLTESIK